MEEVSQAEPIDELDRLKIERLTAMRRAQGRQISWVMLAAAALAVVAMQLAYFTIGQIRGGAWVRAAVYAIVVITCIAFSLRLFRIARRMQAQMHRQATDDAAAADPDFTLLSDGSQRYRNLDEIH